MNNETKKSITGDITPLPWKVIEDEYELKGGEKVYKLPEYYIATEAIHPQLKREDLISGVWISLSKEGKPQHHSALKKENAAYIVRACNLFPELVEALEECISDLKTLEAIFKDGKTGAYEEIKSNISNAKALIQKAKQ